LPFGYDDGWFPITDPSTTREGIVFMGTWHPRRERYLDALHGLPLTVFGSEWQRARELACSPPSYQQDAGKILQQAAIAINIFHPHNAGAHNMRTRELAASGTLQLTDPGLDGTPLRDNDGCRWFSSPGHLRELVQHYLAHPGEASSMARRAQFLAGDETYRRRANQLLALFEDL
jgi:spore maturation protein CgeB